MWLPNLSSFLLDRESAGAVLDWQDLVESLSMLELEELLLELGYKQAGEIKRQYQVNEMGLRRAKYRVKEKSS